MRHQVVTRVPWTPKEIRSYSSRVPNWVSSWTLRELPYARAKRAIAPANAYAMGLFDGAAFAETWAGAEEDGDGVVEIVAVEAGRVVVGGGATTIEETS